MRYAWLAVLVACGHQATAPPPPSQQGVPRLLPPPPLLDLDAPDAMYRTAVALQLQPSWAQFLDDCRLRLPATHALNVMSLAAVAELAIDARGQLVEVRLTSSGSADFDRAIHQVIADAVPLPRPPRELWSDDDHVHVRWLFARDRRQAGPATAHVTYRELPVRDVVIRLVQRGDLPRAVRRIRRVTTGSERDVAIHAVMVAALSEGLTSSDAVVRRSAVDAIGRAGVGELATSVRDLLTTTSDNELRVAALEATARLGDHETIAIALDQLRADVRDDRRLATVETRALVTLGASEAAARVLADELDRGGAPNPIALHALAFVTIHGTEARPLFARLASWLRSGDARVREGACAALANAPGATRWAGLARGIRDRDATVRASCLEAAAVPLISSAEVRAVLPHVRELARDRDATVRARAIAALAVLDPAMLHDASSDRAAEVRAAYAAAIARSRDRDAVAVLRAMLEDRDAGVRAAAWAAWLAVPDEGTTRARLAVPDEGTTRARLAARAATDPAAQVRRAALPALDDDAVVTRLATSDDDPDVRTDALVALAARRGRAATTDLLLDRLAAAPPGGADRVRAALAWLLAR